MANILLLEPDNELANVYTRSLKNAGHTIHTAKSAQMAIQVVDAQTIDLVVMELQLVRHNGIEFLYELRSYSDWQELPIIIQSYQSPDIMDNAVLRNHIKISHYLYKPQTKNTDLLRAVQEVAVAVS